MRESCGGSHVGQRRVVGGIVKHSNTNMYLSVYSNRKYIHSFTRIVPALTKKHSYSKMTYTK